jgi:hypothetical protein
MSGLLHLYPRAWRERYGDELAALLEARPPSPLDQFDLIRGAFDARLHPQVPGADVRPDKGIPVQRRGIGLMAALGGVAWIVGVVSLFALPRDVEGGRDTSIAVVGLAIGTALTGIALGELGSRRGSAGSVITGHVIAAIGISFAILVTQPWPMFIIPLYGFPVLGLIAATRGHLNGILPNWLPLVFAIAMVGAFAGYSGSIETDPGALLVGAVGLAALALAWVAIKGHGRETSEVSPA